MGKKKSTNSQILNFQSKITYFHSLMVRNACECPLLYARDCEKMFRTPHSLVEILLQLPSHKRTDGYGITVIGTLRTGHLGEGRH